ncbi:hypothetical protein EOA27_04895 [Mesorhizobium sp. M2A.F.Ca.ET.037.01.1.1]|uniref:hypothetical protein n=1 Tax=unclassified Mesorhizobium TaxID=325217 RepID=UPI000FCB87F3|nr:MULTISPECIES: hypothetical protein [unclassified Mesorhizobium]RVC69275.1 hypothetical protein EN759_08585 [Mesorhizobium sp. M00.F.Ca.ET.038.03.1.1]RVC82108.1 hypothetical protein EN766_01730 [Mesorhizobium sp. M2A.F.Ca.ET.046.02.1.1]RUX21878.1 hypothetical protein EOA27_04895 [Mesorhizobium sp. M2A.F.Ca.ET.037.01.1.1]RWF35606.1 MAG: hypothetical protein EOS44_07940 [Mesorhizobium sp.]RWX61111.1 hypothetical protein EOA24_31185 [Mesorhizobium sp. M2A.F.Ca.ET.039.01.1.1]
MIKGILSSGPSSPLSCTGCPSTQGCAFSTSLQMVGKSDPLLLSALQVSTSLTTAFLIERRYLKCLNAPHMKDFDAKNFDFGQCVEK